MSETSQEKDQAIQKRAYKLLAYILEHRLDASLGQFQEILDSLLLGVGSSMSAAKRYRLKCLKVAQPFLTLDCAYIFTRRIKLASQLHLAHHFPCLALSIQHTSSVIFVAQSLSRIVLRSKPFQTKILSV